MSLNILFLTQTYPRQPGDTSGPFIRDLARGLVRGGDRVSVLTPHAPDTRETWDDDGVSVRTFRYAPERFEVLGYSRSLRKDETMRVGALGVTPLYVFAARRAIRRHLAHNSTDLIHAHWIVPNGIVAAPAGRKVPLALGLHGSDVFVAEKPAIRPLLKSALRRARLLTGCSPELVDRIRALGFSKEASRVIPYGVDGETFSPDPGRRSEWRDRLGVPTDSPMMLSVGRMATKKGYQILMQALPELLARHPEAHLVLAGAGDRLDEFRAAAKAMGDAGERVHFPGAVLRDTLPDLFRAADIFTLPAVHDPKGNVDGLPNVILEAMATGLPVVASEISGIPLAITDGEHGLLVPEQDPAALLAALDRVLRNREAARAMGEAGRRKAVEQLSWDAIAARYRAGYADALGLET